MPRGRVASRDHSHALATRRTTALHDDENHVKVLLASRLHITWLDAFSGRSLCSISLLSGEELEGGKAACVSSLALDGFQQGCRFKAEAMPLGGQLPMASFVPLSG